MVKDMTLNNLSQDVYNIPRNYLYNVGDLLLKIFEIFNYIKGE